MNNNNVMKEKERYLKRVLKNKVSINQGTVIAYLIAGFFGVQMSEIALNKSLLTQEAEAAYVAINTTTGQTGQSGNQTPNTPDGNMVLLAPTANNSGWESVIIGTGVNTNFGSNTPAATDKNIEIVAIGHNVKTLGTNLVAIGHEALVTGSNSIGIGDSVKVKQQNATAVGKEARVNGEQGTAIGNKSFAYTQATALGSDAYARGVASIAMGSDDLVVWKGTARPGQNDTTYDQKMAYINKDASFLDPVTNYDYNNYFKALYAESLPGETAGGLNNGGGYGNFNLTGEAAKKDFNRIYSPTLANGLGAIAIGSRTIAAAKGATALGTIAYALKDRATALGTYSRAEGVEAAAIGSYSNAIGTGAATIGSHSNAIGEGATAIGSRTNIFAANSVGVGNNIQILKSGGMGYGYKAYAGGDNSIAIGSDVYANTKMTLDATHTAPNKTLNQNSYTYYIHNYDTTRDNDSQFSYYLEENATSARTNAKVDKELYANYDNYEKALEGIATLDATIAAQRETRNDLTNRDLKAIENVVRENGKNAIVIGSRSMALGDNSIAFGRGSYGLAQNSFAMGSYSYADAKNSMAIGMASRALGENTIAMGVGTGVGTRANNTVAIGTGSVAYGENSILMGTDSRSGKRYNGQGTIYDGKGNIVIGNTSKVYGDQNITFGNNITINTGGDTTSTSYAPTTTTNMALGTNITIHKGVSNSVAIGTNSEIGSTNVENNITNSAAFGVGAKVLNASHVADADLTTVTGLPLTHSNPYTGEKGQPTITITPIRELHTGKNAMAIGNESVATLENSVALGVSSKTDYTENSLVRPGWTAEGAFSIPTTGKVGVVSVGSKGHERRIVNLASGAEDTDAVNVAQLRSLAEKINLSVGSSFTVSGNGRYLSVEKAYVANQDGTPDLARTGEAGKISLLVDRRQEFSNYVEAKTQYLYILARKHLNGDTFDEAQVDRLKEQVEAYEAKPVIKKAIADNSKLADINSSSWVGYNIATDSRRTKFAEAMREINTAKNLDVKYVEATDGTGILTQAELEEIKDSNYESNTAVGRDSTAIGYKAKTDTNSPYTIAIGHHSTSTAAKDAIAIGVETQVTAEGAIAIGGAKDTRNVSDTTYNEGAKSTAKNAIALGRAASATIEGGIALGAGSTTNGAANAAGYDPATNANSIETSAAWKSTDAALSLGAAGRSRQITNVAAGTNDTDAVNVAQLKKAVGSTTYKADGGLSSGTILASSASTQPQRGAYTFTLQSTEGWTNGTAKFSGDNIEVLHKSSNNGEVQFHIGMKEQPIFKAINIADGLQIGPGITPTGIDMNNGKISEVGTPTDNNDAANKGYVDTAVSGAKIAYQGNDNVTGKTSTLATGLKFNSSDLTIATGDNGNLTLNIKPNTVAKADLVTELQNEIDGKANKDLSNLSQTGKDNISKLAAKSVVVAKGTNVTSVVKTPTTADPTQVTYTVNVDNMKDHVKASEVAAAGTTKKTSDYLTVTGAAANGYRQEYTIKLADEVITKLENLDPNAKDTYAKKDASNVGYGPNGKPTTGTPNATQAANAQDWRDALDTYAKNEVYNKTEIENKMAASEETVSIAANSTAFLTKNVTPKNVATNKGADYAIGLTNDVITKLNNLDPNANQKYATKQLDNIDAAGKAVITGLTDVVASTNPNNLAKVTNATDATGKKTYTVEVTAPEIAKEAVKAVEVTRKAGSSEAIQVEKSATSTDEKAIYEINLNEAKLRETIADTVVVSTKEGTKNLVVTTKKEITKDNGQKVTNYILDLNMENVSELVANTTREKGIIAYTNAANERLTLGRDGKIYKAEALENMSYAEDKQAYYPTTGLYKEPNGTYYFDKPKGHELKPGEVDPVTQRANGFDPASEYTTNDVRHSLVDPTAATTDAKTLTTATVLDNIKDGLISGTSDEAINGSQLHDLIGAGAFTNADNPLTTDVNEANTPKFVLTAGADTAKDPTSTATAPKYNYTNVYDALTALDKARPVVKKDDGTGRGATDPDYTGTNVNLATVREVRGADGTITYYVGAKPQDIEQNTNISYKAGDEQDAKTTTLSSGLHFKAAGNALSVATGDSGVVTYTVNQTNAISNTNIDPQTGLYKDNVDNPLTTAKAVVDYINSKTATKGETLKFTGDNKATGSEALEVGSVSLTNGQLDFDGKGGIDVKAEGNKLTLDITSAIAENKAALDALKGGLTVSYKGNKADEATRTTPLGQGINFTSTSNQVEIATTAGTNAAPGTVDFKLTTGSVGTEEIKDKSITTDDISDQAIDALKIKDGAITEDKLNDDLKNAIANANKAANKDLSNITEAGKAVITGLTDVVAPEKVLVNGVEKDNLAKITSATDSTGKKTYTVSVAAPEIAKEAVKAVEVTRKAGSSEAIQVAKAETSTDEKAIYEINLDEAKLRETITDTVRVTTKENNQGLVVSEKKDETNEKGQKVTTYELDLNLEKVSELVATTTREKGLVAYTNDAGDRLVIGRDNQVYKASDLVGKEFDETTKKYYSPEVLDKQLNGTYTMKPGSEATATPVAKYEGTDVRHSLVDPTSATTDATALSTPSILDNIKDGLISDNSDEAVNGSQLKDTNAKLAEYLGGGAAFAAGTKDAPNGTWTAPTFALNDWTAADNAAKNYNNVGDALTSLNKGIQEAKTTVVKNPNTAENLITVNPVVKADGHTEYELSVTVPGVKDQAREAVKVVPKEGTIITVDTNKDEVNHVTTYTIGATASEIQQKTKLTYVGNEINATPKTTTLETGLKFKSEGLSITTGDNGELTFELKTATVDKEDLNDALKEELASFAKQDAGNVGNNYTDAAKEAAILDALEKAETAAIEAGIAKKLQEKPDATQAELIAAGEEAAKAFLDDEAGLAKIAQDAETEFNKPENLEKVEAAAKANAEAWREAIGANKIKYRVNDNSKEVDTNSADNTKTYETTLENGFTFKATSSAVPATSGTTRAADTTTATRKSNLTVDKAADGIITYNLNETDAINTANIGTDGNYLTGENVDNPLVSAKALVDYVNTKTAKKGEKLIFAGDNKVSDATDAALTKGEVELTGDNFLDVDGKGGIKVTANGTKLELDITEAIADNKAAIDALKGGLTLSYKGNTTEETAAKTTPLGQGIEFTSEKLDITTTAGDKDKAGTVNFAIKEGAIGTTELANDAVDGTKIKDGSVGKGDLTDDLSNELTNKANKDASNIALTTLTPEDQAKKAAEEKLAEEAAKAAEEKLKADAPQGTTPTAQEIAAARKEAEEKAKEDFRALPENKTYADAQAEAKKWRDAIDTYAKDEVYNKTEIDNITAASKETVVSRDAEYVEVETSTTPNEDGGKEFKVGLTKAIKDKLDNLDPDAKNKYANRDGSNVGLGEPTGTTTLADAKKAEDAAVDAKIEEAKTAAANAAEVVAREANKDKTPEEITAAVEKARAVAAAGVNEAEVEDAAREAYRNDPTNKAYKDAQANAQAWRDALGITATSTEVVKDTGKNEDGSIDYTSQTNSITVRTTTTKDGKTTYHIGVDEKQLRETITDTVRVTTKENNQGLVVSEKKDETNEKGQKVTTYELDLNLEKVSELVATTTREKGLVAYTNDAGDRLVIGRDNEVYKASDLVGKEFDETTKKYYSPEVLDKQLNGTYTMKPGSEATATPVAKYEGTDVRHSLVDPTSAKTDATTLGTASTLDNIKDGLISATSDEAVNGSQLYDLIGAKAFTNTDNPQTPDVNEANTPKFELNAGGVNDTKKSYDNVYDALQALDTAITKGDTVEFHYGAGVGLEEANTDAKSKSTTLAHGLRFTSRDLILEARDNGEINFKITKEGNRTVEDIAREKGTVVYTQPDGTRVAKGTDNNFYKAEDIAGKVYVDGFGYVNNDDAKELDNGKYELKVEVPADTPKEQVEAKKAELIEAKKAQLAPTLPTALNDTEKAELVSSLVNPIAEAGKDTTTAGKLTNIADGEISKDSTDAINGSQLFDLIGTIKNPADGTNGTDGRDGSKGVDGTNSVDGKDGAAGQDGLNGENLSEKIDALRRGEAGPVVYTYNDNGTDVRVTRGMDGKYYKHADIDDKVYVEGVGYVPKDAAEQQKDGTYQLKAVDGKTPEEVKAEILAAGVPTALTPEQANTIRHSLVNRDGNVDNKPSILTNVADGEIAENSTDAINGSQLYDTNKRVSALEEKMGDPKKDGTDGRNGSNGVDGNASVDGKDGAAGKDGLNGQDLTEKVNALRRGEAGPVVYTYEKDGTEVRVVRGLDGKYYVASELENKVYVEGVGYVDSTKAQAKADGSGNELTDAAKAEGENLAKVTALTPEETKGISHSLVGRDGTTTSPSKLNNVAEGTLSETSKEAVNGSQLYAAGTSTAAAIGGGATFDPATGTISKPSIVINRGLEPVDTKPLEEAVKAAEEAVKAAENGTPEDQKKAADDLAKAKEELKKAQDELAGRTKDSLADAIKELDDAISTGKHVPLTYGAGKDAEEAKGDAKTTTLEEGLKFVSKSLDITTGKDGVVRFKISKDDKTVEEMVNEKGPIVYTLEDGTKVSKGRDGQLYKAADITDKVYIEGVGYVGKDNIVTDEDGVEKLAPGVDANTVAKAETLPADTKLIHSLVNPNAAAVAEAGKTDTTTPSKLTNVADGTIAKDSKDAINGGQLFNVIGDPRKDGTDGRNGSNGVDGNASVDGKDGAAGKDGLNGKDLSEKVNALRRGEAGPVVYTYEKDGTEVRVVRGLDGKYYVASDLENKVYVEGVGYVDSTKAQAKADGSGNELTDAAKAEGENLAKVTALTPEETKGISHSLVGRDGTTTSPSKLNNVAEGTLSETSKEAVNGSQLYAAGTSTAEAIGGGATFDPVTGKITKPTIVINRGLGSIDTKPLEDAVKAAEDAVKAAENGTPEAKQKAADDLAKAKEELKKAQDELAGRTKDNLADAIKELDDAISTGKHVPLSYGAGETIEGTKADKTTTLENGIKFVSSALDIKAYEDGNIVFKIDKNDRSVEEVVLEKGTVVYTKEDGTRVSIGRDKNYYNTNELEGTVYLKDKGVYVDKEKYTVEDPKTGAINLKDEYKDKTAEELKAEGIAVTPLENTKENPLKLVHSLSNPTVADNPDTPVDESTTTAGKLTNIANGDVTATSKDAINGSQLYEVKQLIGDPATDGKDGRNGSNGIDGKPTVDGKDGAAGKDGLNGQDLTEKVNALRRGEAGPVVYTDADGNRIVRGLNGQYYKADDIADKVYVDGKYYNETDIDKATGKPTTTAVAATPLDETAVAGIKHSLVGRDGTTTAPSILSNVKAGVADTDAVNVSQLKESLRTADNVGTKNLDKTLEEVAEKAKNDLLKDKPGATAEEIKAAQDKAKADATQKAEESAQNWRDAINTYSKEEINNLTASSKESVESKDPNYITAKAVEGKKNTDGGTIYEIGLTDEIKNKLDNLDADAKNKYANRDASNVGLNNITENTSAEDKAKAEKDAQNWRDAIDVYSKDEVKSATEIGNNQKADYINAAEKAAVEKLQAEKIGATAEEINAAKRKAAEEAIKANVAPEKVAEELAKLDAADKSADDWRKAIDTYAKADVYNKTEVYNKDEVYNKNEINDLTAASKETVVAKDNYINVTTAANPNADGGKEFEVGINTAEMEKLIADTVAVKSDQKGVNVVGSSIRGGNDRTYTVSVDEIGYGADNNVDTPTKQAFGSNLTVVSAGTALTKEGYTDEYLGRNVVTKYTQDANGNGKIEVGVSDRPVFAMLNAEQSLGIGKLTGEVIVDSKGNTVTDSKGNAIKERQINVISKENTDGTITNEIIFAKDSNGNGTGRITGLETPTDKTDAATKEYVDSKVGRVELTSPDGREVERVEIEGQVYYFAKTDVVKDADGNITGLVANAKPVDIAALSNSVRGVDGTMTTPTRLSNIAEGVLATDAVNKAQLDRVDRKADKALDGVAHAVAMANLPQINDAGSNKHNLAASVGHYEGRSAVAVGLSGISDSGRVIYRASASVDDKKQFAVGAGLGYQIGQRNVTGTELERLQAQMTLLQYERKTETDNLRDKLAQEIERNNANTQMIQQLFQEIERLKQAK